MGPVRSSTNATPWGAYSPCCHLGAGNYSDTRAVTVQPVPNHSWVKRVHIQVKCLAQGHSVTPRQERPVPKTSRSKLVGRATGPRCLACTWSVYSDIGTLRAVTAGKLFRQWLFYVPLNVGDTAPLFTWSREPRETHSFQC